MISQEVNAFCLLWVNLDFDFCAQELYKFAADGGVAWPCWRGNEVSIYNSFVSANFYIGATSQADVWTNCCVAGSLVAI